MSKVRKLVTERPEDLQGILLVALAERSGGSTVVTEAELEAAAVDKGVYLTILEDGIRLEALPADEVRAKVKPKDKEIG